MNIDPSEDKLHEETNEPHDGKTNYRLKADLLVLCVSSPEEQQREIKRANERC